MRKSKEDLRKSKEDLRKSKENLRKSKEDLRSHNSVDAIHDECTCSEGHVELSPLTALIAATDQVRIILFEKISENIVKHSQICHLKRYNEFIQ